MNIRAMHTPTMHGVVFFWRGSPVDNFALPQPRGGGGGVCAAASIIGMQSLLIKRWIFLKIILPIKKLSILDTYFKNVAALLIYTYLPRIKNL